MQRGGQEELQEENIQEQVAYAQSSGSSGGEHYRLEFHCSWRGARRLGTLICNKSFAFWG